MISSCSWGLQFEQEQSYASEASIPPMVKKPFSPRIHSSSAQQRGRQRNDHPAFYNIVKRLVQYCPPRYSEYCQPVSGRSALNLRWEGLPGAVHPHGGGLPANRVLRKTQQVQNLLAPLIVLLRACLAARQPDEPPVRVVEFCAGSGFVLLPLAALFPEAHCVLIDCKPRSVQIARERVAAAGLTNVLVLEARIEAYEEPFSIGIALHACGAATDVSMQKCVQAGAAFVLAPCCIGKVTFDTHRPRSSAFNAALQRKRVGAGDSAVAGAGEGEEEEGGYDGGGRGDWAHVVRAADFSHGREALSDTPINAGRRLAKAIVEWDRRTFAAEAGYYVYLQRMYPVTASPKNDVLVGWPLPWGAGSAHALTEESFGVRPMELAAGAFFGGERGEGGDSAGSRGPGSMSGGVMARTQG